MTARQLTLPKVLKSGARRRAAWVRDSPFIATDITAAEDGVDVLKEGDVAVEWAHVLSERSPNYMHALACTPASNVSGRRNIAPEYGLDIFPVTDDRRQRLNERIAVILGNPLWGVDRAFDGV